MTAAEMLAQTVPISPVVEVCSCGFRHTFAGWLALPLDGHQEIEDEDSSTWADQRTCRQCRSSRLVRVSELVAIDRAAYVRNVRAAEPFMKEQARRACLVLASAARVVALLGGSRG